MLNQNLNERERGKKNLGPCRSDGEKIVEIWKEHSRTRSREKLPGVKKKRGGKTWGENKEESDPG